MCREEKGCESFPAGRGTASRRCQRSDELPDAVRTVSASGLRSARSCCLFWQFWGHRWRSRWISGEIHGRTDSKQRTGRVGGGVLGGTLHPAPWRQSRELRACHSLGCRAPGQGHVPPLISQSMTRNATRAGVNVEEPLSEPQRRGGENCSGLISNSLADIESSLQRDAEAAYVHPEVGLHGTRQPHGSASWWGAPAPAAGCSPCSAQPVSPSTARLPRLSCSSLPSCSSRSEGPSARKG